MSIKGNENEATKQNIDRDPEKSDDTGGPLPRTVTVHQRDAKLVIIDHPDVVYSLAFLAGGKEVFSGDREGKIRRWRVEDGMEVGIPMDAGSSVFDLVVSRDGRWIVAGTGSGQVVVWNSTTFEKVNDFKAHDLPMNAVDISVDGTKIATGSDDHILSVWSFPTVDRLLGFLAHDNNLATVKFSPDGKFIATATWGRYSVRIYDSLDGTLLANFPIEVNTLFNGSLAWTGDGKQIFALSRDGNVHCLDVSSRTTISQWSIHSDNTYCITLACDDACVAVSANSSVSFWDTATHQQIGPVINYAHPISSMVISSNYDMVAAGDETITLRSLYDVLSPSYLKANDKEIIESQSESNVDLLEDNRVLVDLHSTETGDGVDPLEFFPGGSSIRTDVFGATDPKKILDILIRSGIYSEEKWLFDRVPVLDSNGRQVSGPTFEQEIAALFNEIFKAAARTNVKWESAWSHYAWRSHASTAIQNQRKPDVILVDKHLQYARSVSYNNIFVYCEVKKPWATTNLQEAQLQLAEIAGLVTASQVHRRFFIGFSLVGGQLQLVLYVRGVKVYSKPFDIHTNPQLFITVILNLCLVDSISHGFDDSFKDLGQGNFELEIGDLVIVTNVTLFHSISIRGRGTKVTLCSRSERSGKRKFSNYVLKDCWLPQGTNDIDVHTHLLNHRPKSFVDKEEEKIFGEDDQFDIFRDCSQAADDVWDYASKLPGIPIIAASEIPTCWNPCVSTPQDAPRPEQKRADTTENILSRFTKSVSYEPRTHVRVLSATCGTPLTWFSCRRELLNGLMCAIAGHFNGLRKNVLHCDVSDTNVWFLVSDLSPQNVVPDWPQDGSYTKRAGILGDWGLAEIRDSGRPDDNMAGTVTGTYPFLAAELLSSNQVRHEAHHDLESFFWLLWITCVNMNGPYLNRRLWRSSRNDSTTPRSSTQSSVPRSSARLSRLVTTIGNMREPQDAASSDDHVPSWATPGVHSCSPAEVYSWKRDIPVTAFISSLSPYFSSGDAGQPIIDGLQRLRNHFVWSISRPDNKPRQPRTITHKIFIEILREMRDSIPADADCPSKEDIDRGRRSYETLVNSGRGLDVPVMEEASSRSTSKGATAPRISRSKSSRRTAEELSQDSGQRSSSYAKRRRT